MKKREGRERGASLKGSARCRRSKSAPASAAASASAAGFVRALDFRCAESLLMRRSFEFEIDYGRFAPFRLLLKRLCSLRGFSRFSSWADFIEYAEQIGAERMPGMNRIVESILGFEDAQARSFALMRLLLSRLLLLLQAKARKGWDCRSDLFHNIIISFYEAIASIDLRKRKKSLMQCLLNRTYHILYKRYLKIWLPKGVHWWSLYDADVARVLSERMTRSVPKV